MDRNHHITKNLMQIAMTALITITACKILQASALLEPPGRVSGKITYQDLKATANPEPLPDVLVALCRISENGLPQRPPVSTSSQKVTLCTLQETLSTRSTADGAFTLEDVPSGAYLVMFHLFPDQIEMDEVEWDGVVLTEAALNEVEGVISPSNKPGFWETGGPVIGTTEWGFSEGGRVTKGNICSNTYGFCFSVLNERLHPVINVESDRMVEANLTAHFKRKDQTMEPALIAQPPVPTPTSTTRPPTSTAMPKPATATPTPTIAPIQGIDFPIEIKNVSFKNSLGVIETADIKVKILDVSTEKSLKSGTKTLYPKDQSDIFLSLKLFLDGPLGSMSWIAIHATVLCNGETHKAIDTLTIEFDKGLLQSWRIYYEVPADAGFEACRLQLPDGREIPLGRFFGSPQPAASFAATPKPSTTLPSFQISPAPGEQVILIANKNCRPPKVTSSEGIVIRVRWGATTPELAESNADHFTFVFLVDGKDIGDIRPYRQPAESYSSQERYGCSASEILSWVHWDVPIGQMSAGTHTVSVNYTLDEAISDGLQDYAAGPSGFDQITFFVLR